MPANRTAELDSRVLEVLRRRGGTTPSAVGHELGPDRQAIKWCLAWMQRQGRARCVGMTDARRSWGVSAPAALWEAVPEASG